MKRTFLKLIFMLLPVVAVAQNDGYSGIAITPYVSEDTNLPVDAQNILYQRMLSLVTKNGWGSVSYDFMLTPAVAVLDKGTTATAPVKYTTELEITLYAVAIQERIIVGTTSVTVRGIGNSEGKAAIEAIKSINFKNPALRSFINVVRDKIVEYYEQRIPVLMSKAQLLAKNREYGEALSILAAVPESVEDYKTVLNYMSELLQQKIDLEAEMALNSVDVLLVKGEYDEALDILAGIDPLSKHYPAAKGKVAGIKAAIDAEMEAAAAERAEKLELDMEAEQRRLDNETRQAELEKAAQMSSKNTLSGSIGDMLLECVKDIFTTK